jgi:SAM-dependent methyltransferase
MWRRASFALSYRTGRTPWDTGITPPEVVELIEGPSALVLGRALDVGCGTGTNVGYLARHGWEAVGLDASSRAIAAARQRVAEISRASVMQADVTRLASLSLGAPFDLVLDVGCYHSVARHRREDYAAGVAEQTITGATLFVFAFAGRGATGVTAREMRDRFAPWFEPVGRIAGTQPPGAAWYRLRRL